MDRSNSQFGRRPANFQYNRPVAPVASARAGSSSTPAESPEPEEHPERAERDGGQPAAQTDYSQLQQQQLQWQQQQRQHHEEQQQRERMESERQQEIRRKRVVQNMVRQLEAELELFRAEERATLEKIRIKEEEAEQLEERETPPAAHQQQTTPLRRPYQVRWLHGPARDDRSATGETRKLHTASL